MTQWTLMTRENPTPIMNQWTLMDKYILYLNKNPLDPLENLYLYKNTLGSESQVNYLL
jgi:hypothetical protein